MSEIVQSVANKGNILVRVTIPEALVNFNTPLSASLTIKEVKAQLMTKLKRAGTKNVNPANYFIKIGGMRVLDESNRLEQLAKGGQMEMEVARPIEFELVGNNATDESQVALITETMDAATAAMKCAKLLFPSVDLKYSPILPSILSCFALFEFTSYLCFKTRNVTLSMYVETPEGVQKLDPTASFLSNGFRCGVKIELFAEPTNGKGDVIKDIIIIQYSPFDVLDRQKEMLSKRGFLKVDHPLVSFVSRMAC